MSFGVILSVAALVLYTVWSMSVDFEQVPGFTFLQKLIRWLGHPMGGGNAR